MAGNTHKNWKAQPKQLDPLDQLLADKPSDEKGGLDGALGFSFQQWWAAFVVVELLEKQEEFAVGMEVKEDVAVLDSADTPTRVEFCQIKKNERAGAWTLSALHAAARATKGDSPPVPSTLAKLYSRRHGFAGHPTKLRFVSNVGFKIPAEGGGTVHSHSCTLSELKAESVEELKKIIAKQLALNDQTIDLTEFHLERTNLPLGDQHLMVAGKLTELCNSNALPFALDRPTVAARMLALELQERSSNTNFAKTFQELKARLLSRSDALKILSAVATETKAPLQSELESAINRLNIERYDFLALRRMEAQLVSVCAAAVDRTNLLLRNLVQVVSESRNKLLAQPSPPVTLGSLLDSTIGAAKAANPTQFAGLAPGYAELVALLVLYEAITIDVFTVAADTKSEEEK